MVYGILQTIAGMFSKLVQDVPKGPIHKRGFRIPEKPRTADQKKGCLCPRIRESLLQEVIH